MAPTLLIVPLREQPDAAGFFAPLFEREWPNWYGPGGQGNAATDLAAFANPAGELPVGVLAVAADGSRVGVAALKAASLPGFGHLTPWASAGFVVPGMRRQGVGAALLRALLVEARRLGYPFVYCATATAASLLDRQGGRLVKRVEHEGSTVSVYSIAVPPKRAIGAA